jgi:hypothetical protein
MAMHPHTTPHGPDKGIVRKGLTASHIGGLFKVGGGLKVRKETDQKILLCGIIHCRDDKMSLLHMTGTVQLHDY